MAVAAGSDRPGQPLAEAATPPPAAAADKAGDPIALETSDGVEISTWHYPPPEGVAALGTVLLVHDIGGSHRTVEPLARALSAAGYAVVSPDLRGHGGSPLKSLRPAGENADQSKLLRKGDFEMMAASREGRLREQSGVRGDLECVRNWIKARADEGKMRISPLFVVGCGLGGTVAATWTVADAEWPDIASGPQGRQVAGLVLVSPVFADRGYSLRGPLGSDLLARSLPLLIIAGTPDHDAGKIFDQLKRNRPKLWYDSRQTAEERAASGQAGARPTLFLLQPPIDESGDRLAAFRAADPGRTETEPAVMITRFMSAAVPRGR